MTSTLPTNQRTTDFHLSPRLFRHHHSTGAYRKVAAMINVASAAKLPTVSTVISQRLSTFTVGSLFFAQLFPS